MNQNTPIEELDLSVRTFNVLKRAGINTVGEAITAHNEGMITGLTAKEILKKTGEDISLALPAVTMDEHTAATFNYAVLSAELGDYLRNKEQQLKNEYMNFTANCGAIFAEAQERLANNKNGLFEKWIESMGFKRTTVYRMIDVYKFISSQIGTISEKEIFESLPKSLQYEIAKPSAPQELVTKVLDGDITSHAEYIKMKNELETQRKNYKNVLDENQTLRRDRVTAMNRADDIERERNKLRDNNVALAEDIDKLRAEIKELKSRPVDVAVESDTVTIDELNDKIYSLNATMSNLEQQLNNERRRCSQLEHQLKESNSDELFGDYSDEELPVTKAHEFFNLLYGKVSSAITDCYDFARNSGYPEDYAEDFKNIIELVETLADELEE